MKKILLLSTSIFALSFAQAQVGTDTLLWNNFNTDPAAYMQIAIPLGLTTDTTWYTFDIDGLADGSSSNRPGEWFWSAAYSDLDSVGNPGVMGSNSWSNTNTPNQNILVTPSIYIGDTNAVFHWKSAPFQTPRYLDGYVVLISTGTNDPSSFTDTVFVASEYTSLDNQAFPNLFSSYTFTPGPTANPMSPFIHGIDSTYTDIAASDSSRLVGRLRPLSVSLAAYSGQNIFIMIVHNSTDDNLISVDDMLVTGTNFTGIQENKNDFAVSLYPNPASDEVNIRFHLATSSSVTFNIYDISGKLVSSVNKGKLNEGEQKQSLNVSGLSAGIYQLEMVTENGKVNSKIVIR